MTTPTPTRTPARRDIQGLRALAVLAVIGAHAVGWPRGGFVGVDVFFVISGFLITGGLLRDLAAHGRIRLGAFAMRRVRRILPAALTVIAATAGVAALVFGSARTAQTLQDAAWSTVFAANWRFADLGTDYFHAGDAVSPLQHFWSLAVEEQFYIVWPVALLLLVGLLPRAARRGRAGRVLVGAAAAVVVAASFVWALAQTADSPTVAYFSTVTRAWELGVGALLAAALPLLRRIPPVIGGASAWLGVAGIVAAFAVIDPEASAFPAPWAALPVAATALVIAGGAAGDPRHRHLFPLTNPVAVFVGDISFSLYLWHFPVIVFAAALLPGGAVATGLVLGVTAVLAIASYAAIEQPLRHVPGRGRATAVEADAPTTAPSADPSADAPSADPSADAPSADPSADAGATTPADTPAPALSTRPAGWSPGTRYYPGRVPAQAMVDPATAAVESAPVGATPAEAAHDASGDPRAFGADAASSPWAAWRARFGPRALGSAFGVAVAALVVVLVVQTAYGGSVLGPLLPDAPVADAADPAGGADSPTVDAAAAVQDELAAAVGASSWPELHPSLDEVMARSSTSNPARDCFAPDVSPDAGRCSVGRGDAPTRIYLVGDSTAMAYAPAFRKMADDSGGGIRVTTVGLYGCRFTDLAVQNDGAGVMDACPQRKADVRAMIAADAPTLVVVSNAYTLGHTPGGSNLSPDALLASQQAEAATYGMPGRIVHLAPPPEGADLGRCYTPTRSPYDCAAGVSTTWLQMEDAAERVAAASGDTAISSLPFSCWENVCPAFAGDIPTRYDRTHLTVAFAEHLAPVIRQQLADRGLL
ncbi:acyltransferase family protein [Microbacterium radiodurans]|uniref:Acyltransferase family protein n=1 Tax=Microbacterium radiodurans TaxID=661398 RepID=A0A5J5IUT2_9MICO|nr:acyltransferase family protein [Microbacterium radiodurans]KAA9089668.1 acyltransferase family protein [Microbacterium radiodurans]